MLKVTVITEENSLQFWSETFENVWEGPVEISLQKEPDVKKEADLVILEFSDKSQNPSELFNAAAPSLTGKHFLIVSDKKDADLAINAVRFGAIGFLVKPFKRHEIISSLDRLHTAPQNNSNLRKTAKTIAVTSYKGGTGVSTAAVNLAFSLANIHDKKTLLIDAAGFSNHITVLLNVIPKSTLSEICKQGNNLDEQYLNNAVSTSGKNLHVISGLMKTSELSDLTTSGLEHLIDIANEIYDFIVIDTSTHVLDETTIMLFQKASDILLITTFDLLAIRDNRFFINTLKEIGISEHKIKPIINRQNWYIGSLEPELIQKQINHQIFHALPNDWELCVEASNYGRPIMEVAPNSPLSTAYNILAAKFTKQDVLNKSTEAAAKTESAKEEKKEKKKGILSWF